MAERKEIGVVATKNDITGDLIQSRTINDDYASGWDRIFGKKSVQEGVNSVPQTEDDLNRQRALDELIDITQKSGLYDHDHDYDEKK